MTSSRSRALPANPTGITCGQGSTPVCIVGCMACFRPSIRCALLSVGHVSGQASDVRCAMAHVSCCTGHGLTYVCTVQWDCCRRRRRAAMGLMEVLGPSHSHRHHLVPPAAQVVGLTYIPVRGAGHVRSPGVAGLLTAYNTHSSNSAVPFTQ